MSAFLDNFQPDSELPERRIWRTAKPLLRHSVVAHAPSYPEYPGLEASEPSNDPSCSSARLVGEEVDVMLYSDTESFGGPHERAWRFILDHSQQVEAALRRKLLAQHAKSLKQFRDEVLPDDEELQTYWKSMEGQVQWDHPSAVDQLFKLVAIGVADSGLDECGFTSFEFQSGWDRDHGLGVLMHRDRVLAADGMTQLIEGGDIVSAVRYIQEYDLDEGDFSLLEG